MATGKSASIAHRLFEVDVSICRWLNRISRISSVRSFFAVVSRLGDGIFWYLLMGLIVVLDPGSGYLHALQMGISALIGVTLYRLLKSRTVRPRPYAQRNDIDMCVNPLDQYSFPSGHTLHAFSFSIIAVSHYPPLLAPLALFTILVALSRMILGLHYPSDVIAGAVLGSSIAAGSMMLLG